MNIYNKYITQLFLIFHKKAGKHDKIRLLTSPAKVIVGQNLFTEESLMASIPLNALMGLEMILLYLLHKPNFHLEK